VIDLLLLGTGGMLPLPNRWLSSLLVRCDGDLILFDCGEGTQIPWRGFGWGFRRLGAICLSHTHADHVAGLRTIAPDLPYELRVTELNNGDRFSLPGGLAGSVVAGDHGLPCLAYRLDLPRARRFSAERARALGVPRDCWRLLQQGRPVTWSGGAADPDDVLGPPRRGLALAYVTDTRPVPALSAFLHGVDLLVCEGTYGDSDHRPKAIANHHMTFAEAASIARDADAGRLWLTHFSPAMPDPADYLDRATAVFPATTVGHSGLSTSLTFTDE